jgi:uncharacterized membrane protein YkoI
MKRALVAVLWLSIAGAPAHAGTTPVTKAQAEKIALAKVPGKVVHDKTKKEKGHLLYSIKIQPKDPKAMEKKVEVDETGKILKVKDIKPKTKDKDD